MGKIGTTLSIDSVDHTRFMAAKLEFMRKQGRQISNTEFFTKLLDYWTEGNNEIKIS